MARLRSTWGMRVMAAFLLASLLPVTFAAAMQAAGHTTSYADWVRAQLREPAGEAVNQALAQAAERKTRSLESFLRAFVAAYEAQHPGAPVAHAFATVNLSNEALITYLQSRFMGVVGEAVLPRIASLAAQASASHVLERGATAYAVPARFDPTHQARAATQRRLVRAVFVLPVRCLFAAQPLGP